MITGDSRLDSVMHIAVNSPQSVPRVVAWADAQPDGYWRQLDSVAEIGPPIDPAAIYAIGQNYRLAGQTTGVRPPRPLVYGKALNSLSGHDGIVAWDRTLTENVDAECELGVVIGSFAWQVTAAEAMDHVFGYTIIDDVSSRDPWLDGDQWLLGKSMNGFCPVGPWIVTADELAPAGLRLGCRLNGQPIQEGTTDDMLFNVAEIVAYLSRHVTLSPGTLIATGTPARLAGPPGPGRHLWPGDVVTCWIGGIGELRSRVR